MSNSFFLAYVSFFDNYQRYSAWHSSMYGFILVVLVSIMSFTVTPHETSIAYVSNLNVSYLIEKENETDSLAMCIVFGRVINKPEFSS